MPVRYSKTIKLAGDGKIVKLFTVYMRLFSYTPGFGPKTVWSKETGEKTKKKHSIYVRKPLFLDKQLFCHD
jgi:hypothetical protein